MDENTMRGKYSWIKYNEKKIQLDTNTMRGLAMLRELHRL